MARETKVGLLIGVGVILLIAIIVNDHLVTVQTAEEPGRLTRFAEATQQELSEQPDVSPGNPDSIHNAYQPQPQTQARRTESDHAIEHQRHPGSTSGEPTRQSLIPTAEELNDGSWQAPRRETPPRSAQGLHAAVRVETDTESDQLDHEQAVAQFATPERGHPMQVGSSIDTATSDRLRALQEQARQAMLIEPARATPIQPTEIARRTPPSNAEVIHYVKPGETLWEIADRYLNDGSQWKQIAAANAAQVDRNNNVAAGARLVIPSGAALAQATQPGGSAGAIDITPRGGQVPTLYTVKAGDSLYKIAQTTLGDGKRFREIYELNRDQMKNENTLKQGMKLKVPARDSASQTATAARETATPVTTQAPARSTATQTYTVKSGDNLYKIAERTLGDGERYREIYAANREMLADENTLEAGQVLKIPG